MKARLTIQVSSMMNQVLLSTATQAANLLLLQWMMLTRKLLGKIVLN
jgi:hypothetical protein